jgi:signal peptidase I
MSENFGINKTEAGSTGKGKFFSLIWEAAKIIIFSLAIVLPVRYFLIQPFFVKGMSMEPSFDDGQYLIINEITYRFNQPERGDVIVFRYPNEPSQYYIKRIIGLPGETIEIIGGGIIVYNNQNSQGLVLDEKKYLDGQKTIGETKITLVDGQYFVLGDNRSASSDSRRWGPLGEDFIIGKVWVRVWPFDKAMVFEAPSY